MTMLKVSAAMFLLALMIWGMTELAVGGGNPEKTDHGRWGGGTGGA